MIPAQVELELFYDDRDNHDDDDEVVAVSSASQLKETLKITNKQSDETRKEKIILYKGSSSNPKLTSQQKTLNGTKSSPTTTSKGTSTTTSQKHESFVFARVRPLLEEEKKSIANEDDCILPDLVIDTTFPQGSNNDIDHSHNNDRVYVMNGSLPIGGYSGVLGTSTSNQDVFQHAFLPRLETVLKGGTSSLFCYGHTGAGKTHTTLGYDQELGLFHLASQELLNSVHKFNERNELKRNSSHGNNHVFVNDNYDHDDSTIETEKLFILASAVEIYNDEVYDLLSENRPKCTLRKNHKNQLLVRGATQKIQFKDEQMKEHGLEYCILTSTLTSIPIHTMNDIQTMQQMILSHRSVGSSSIHDKSSRSHAIFRLDIVNHKLLNALNELEEAESIKPAIQTAYDKKRTYVLRHKVLDIEKKIQSVSEYIESLYEFNGCTTSNDSSSCSNNMSGKDDTTSPFGGRLILVDLAGADSDSRSIGGEKGCTTALERRESQAINKSLLALKECIRSLQSSSKVIPFRNSSLTRMLEEVLTPREKRDSNSVMIVNISPSINLKQKTLNSLRYGEMFLPKVVVTKGVGGATVRAGASAAASSRKDSRSRSSCSERREKFRSFVQQKNTIHDG